MFITSSHPRASPSSEVLAYHVPESPRPRVPTSPRHNVPASPRPRVPKSPSPTSQVPVPLLVIANSIAFFARVPSRLGCCLFLSFEARFQTKVSDWLLNMIMLLFCRFTQKYTASERRWTLIRSPIRLLDLTSNHHLSSVRVTCTPTRTD